jgi:2-amino-4-hydroxy-6-hydroxymethyldihydropteridine diphosphokinase
MNTEVYIGLGGNIGNTVEYLNRALAELGGNPEITHLRCSSFYQTTPVGLVDQADFVNGVCVFNTTFTMSALHAEMRRIETALGKEPQEKNYPRVIDLDLLFFGTDRQNDDQLNVPHHSWNDRLFVLVPLAELTNEIWVPGDKGCYKVSLPDLLNKFQNKNKERVTFLTKPTLAVYP